jgi:hypothetical protein
LAVTEEISKIPCRRVCPVADIRRRSDRFYFAHEIALAYPCIEYEPEELSHCPTFRSDVGLYCALGPPPIRGEQKNAAQVPINSVQSRS